jgi:hypothetical protein
MESVSTVNTAPADAAAPVAPDPRAAAVERHFERVSTLMERAEGLADAMLYALAARVKNGTPVYPGELIQLCRGLHALARCGLELRRQLKLAGRDSSAARVISEADIARIEARLRPLLGKQAA